MRNCVKGRGEGGIKIGPPVCPPSPLLALKYSDATACTSRETGWCGLMIAAPDWASTRCIYKHSMFYCRLQKSRSQHHLSQPSVPHCARFSFGKRTLLWTPIRRPHCKRFSFGKRTSWTPIFRPEKECACMYVLRMCAASLEES